MALTGPCGATPRQVPAVAALADEVFEVRHGWLASMYPTLFHADNAHWLRTFWDGDRPVSLVAVWRGEIETFRRRKVARVGSVCPCPHTAGRPSRDVAAQPCATDGCAPGRRPARRRDGGPPPPYPPWSQGDTERVVADRGLVVAKSTRGLEGRCGCARGLLGAPRA